MYALKKLVLIFKRWFCINFLLALKSSVHSRVAFRDFHPIPVPLTAFEHLSLCTWWQLGDHLAMGMSRNYMGHVWGIIWGMPGHVWASSGVLCMGHHMGHVWGIIFCMSGTSSGACQVHVWGIIWGISGASSVICLGHHLGRVWGSLRYPQCYMHLWCFFGQHGCVKGMLFTWFLLVALLCSFS